MPTADPDLVRSYYEAIDADDYETLLACFDEDVVYERPGQGAIEGIDDLATFYRAERPLEEGSHEVHSLLVDGATVAVRGTFAGRQGERRVEFGFADFFEFTDEGTIGHRYTYTDRDTV